MASQRHEISLRVLKNISRVSAPFELLQVTKCCQRRFAFVECYVTVHNHDAEVYAPELLVVSEMSAVRCPLHPCLYSRAPTG